MKYNPNDCPDNCWVGTRTAYPPSRKLFKKLSITMPLLTSKAVGLGPMIYNKAFMVKETRSDEKNRRQAFGRGFLHVRHYAWYWWARWLPSDSRTYQMKWTVNSGHVENCIDAGLLNGHPSRSSYTISLSQISDRTSQYVFQNLRCCFCVPSVRQHQVS
jgi:hypothetical protein